jgi:hypothetical protein
MSSSTSYDHPYTFKSNPSPRRRLQDWFLKRFAAWTPGVVRSDLLTSYFVSSYGELYDYCTEFLRVTHLMVAEPDAKTTRTEARRMGWRWYRLATPEDLRPTVATTAEEELQNQEEFFERFKQLFAENPEHTKRFVTLAGERPGETREIPRPDDVVFPTFLFHVRYPNEFGEDYWTPQQILERFDISEDEDPAFRIATFLNDVTWRIRRLLESVEQVLKDPGQIATHVRSRRQARTIDLGAVVTPSSTTSSRKAAEKEFLQYLHESQPHV